MWTVLENKASRTFLNNSPEIDPACTFGQNKMVYLSVSFSQLSYKYGSYLISRAIKEIYLDYSHSGPF